MAPSTTAPAQSAAPESQQAQEHDLSTIADEVTGAASAAAGADEDDDYGIEAAVNAALGLDESSTETSTEGEGEDGDQGKASIPNTRPEDGTGEGEAAEQQAEASDAASAGAKGATPAAGFKAFGADGAEVAEVPTLELEFTADGKVRRLPLDRVVRLAQRGFHNEELHAEVDAAREFMERDVPRLQQEAQTVQQENEVLRAELLAVLQDDARLFELREKLEAHLSPEAELARLRSENAALKSGKTQADAARGIADVLRNDAVPAILQVAQQFSNVTAEEAQARFVAMVKPYVTNGVVPPEKLPHVTRAIHSLAAWAEGLHDAREEKKRAEAELSAKAARAQAEAVQAKRAVARATSPSVGAPAAGSPIDAPRRRVAATADEAIEDILEDAIAQIGG